MSRIGRALLLTLLLAAPVRAAVHPNTAGGLPAGQAFSAGGIDNVNLFNGSLTMSVPIGPAYPVNGGFTYQIQAVYNSSPWVFETVNRWVPALQEARDYTSAYANPCANAGMGWRVSLGRINPPCLVPDSNTPASDVYQDETGSDHVFYPTLHVGETATPGTQYTRDGSYLRLKTLADGWRLEHPDGSYRRFNLAGMPIEIKDAFGNGLTITYPANQWVISDTVGRVQRIYFRTDLPQFPQAIDHIDVTAFGGTATYGFAYHSAVTGRPCPHNDNVAPGARGDTDFVPFLVGINLPDGTSYFNADAANYLISVTSGCTPNAGNPLNWTIPTGAQYRYTWQTYRFPTGSSNKPHLQQNPGIATRQVFDPTGGTTGTWTYQTVSTFPTGPELKNTLIDPLGHKRESFFTIALDALPGGTGRGPGDLYDYSLPFTRQSTTDGATLFLSSRVFQNTGTVAAPSYSLNPTRSEYIAWERDPIDLGLSVPHLYNSNRRPFRGRTVFHDDGGSYAETVASNFDGLGHYRQVDSKGSGFLNIPSPSTILRTAIQDYDATSGTYTVNLANNSSGGNFSMLAATSPWVLERMKHSSVTEGGQTAKTEFCYYPNTTRIVRTRVRRAATGLQSANDLVSVVDLSEGGTVRGNAAIESFYGGDGAGQAVLAVNETPLCSLPLPAAEYQVVSTYSGGVQASAKYSQFAIKTLDLTIDASTGLPSASRDEAGLETGFEYDLMGRLTWTKPAIGHGGWTESFYTVRPPFSGVVPNVIVRRRGNGAKGAPILVANQQTFDGLGRVHREFGTLPNGTTTKRESLYDAAGNPASVSTWFTGANSVTKTETKNYDAFGRATKIVPPDGATHSVDLVYTGARQLTRTTSIATSLGGESASTTTEVYDRFGRLVQLQEPSGSGGALVTTAYGYDVGNRLTSASTTSGATQNRTFTYDMAGMLKSEVQPEKGISGNATVSYPKYDSRGHLLQKVDGANDLTYLYDKAERTTQVKETAGLGRVLKSFTWSDAAAADFFDPLSGSTCTNYTRGKLVGQSRFNYVTLFGSPFKVEIREGMTYCGRDGRLSRQSLDNYVNNPATANESFVWPNWTYDVLGNVTSFAYPQCTHAGCSAPTPRTVQNSYTEGLLTQVGIPGTPGRYTNSITYHPNGVVKDVVHANTPSIASTWVTDTYGVSTNGMARPTSITSARNGTTLWRTDTYAYDGAGNVKSIGQQTFVYDKVSRLTQANLCLDAIQPAFPATCQGRNATYGYDAFGNLLSISGSVNRTIQTTPGTNHLIAPTAYDAQGNVSDWNGSHYDYDPFDRMWHYQTATPGDEWIYIYNADDERVWSYRPSANTSFWTLRNQDDSVLREYNNNGTWSLQSDLIHRDGQLLASETSSGLRHFHLDHLGTPRLITDANGNANAFHVYYPYGEEASAFNQDTIREKFTGHERDFANLAGAGDDLDYMHARFYNPMVGRLWSLDPIGGDPRRPQTWHRYAYVYGNPMTLVDPDGQQGAELVYSMFGLTVRASGTLSFGTATAADTLFFGGLSFRATLAMAAAKSGPAVLIVAAGAVGYGTGYLINQIPGVSEAITSGLGVLIEPFVLSQDSGGGKTGRKSSRHAREQGQRLLNELREALEKAKNIRKKEPEDKDLIERLKNAIRRLQDKLRKSENHAQKGQRGR